MKAVLILQALLVCVQSLPLAYKDESSIVNPANEVRVEDEDSDKRRFEDEDSDKSDQLAPPGTTNGSGVSAVGVAVPKNSNLRAGPQLGVKIV